jgi:hypothetical protein
VKTLLAGAALAAASASAFAYYWGHPFTMRWPFVVLAVMSGILTLSGSLKCDAKARVFGGIGLVLCLGGLGGAEIFRLLNPILTARLNAGQMTEAEARLFRSTASALPAVVLAAGWLWASIGRLQQHTGEPPQPRIPRTVKEPLDIEVCRTRSGPLILKHMDRYTHTLVVGTTGTGKTSRVLKPMVYQDLEAIAAGRKAGITIIEPKGSFAADVADMCRSMGIPCTFINPEDANTAKFNPLEGEPEPVSEIMRTVLRSLFGRQEAFFRLNQEVMARNTALLVKEVYGEEATMEHMIRVLRDSAQMAWAVNQLRKKRGDTAAVVQYFSKEVMGEQQDKIQQFTLGLRQQLEDITNNTLMRRVLLGKSDVDLHQHLSQGGVLVVNTAMGALGKLGDVFGQFVALHVQNAVFSRPGPEHTRTPHILYIDEFPRYLNPDFERMLSIGREYRCGAVLAIQTIAQLKTEDSGNLQERVLETCRNKIALTLGSNADAQFFSREFGEYIARKEQDSYRYQSDGLFTMFKPDSVKYAEKSEPVFPYTMLMRLEPFTAVVQIVRNGQPIPAVLGNLSLSPWDEARNRAKDRGLRFDFRYETKTKGQKSALVATPEETAHSHASRSGPQAPAPQNGLSITYPTGDMESFMPPPSTGASMGQPLQNEAMAKTDSSECVKGTSQSRELTLPGMSEKAGETTAAATN